MNDHKTMSCVHIEETLRRWSDAYYNGTPEVTDQVFDTLWKAHQENRELLPDDPTWKDTILDKVGAEPKKASGFRKVKHATPMLSLDNVFEVDGDFEQVRAWLAKLPEGRIVRIEPKLDGLSLSLVYENGILVSAVTRGNGVQGDDVTQNIHPDMGIPFSINPDDAWNGAGTYVHAAGRVEVRGEVVMPVPQFERLNAALKAAGEELYANPRNAAAGALRLHDASESRKRGLKFVAYACAGYQYPVNDHSSELARLLQVGFSIPPSAGLVSNDGHEIDWRELKDVLMRGQDYLIAGLVLKIDSYEVREQLGFTSRAPRWAVALKFKQPAAITTLKSITVQVGRTGSLTPVGELEPVEVDGSVISRVTLHNEDQINRLGLQVGDQVEIEKAGGVIPAVVRSVTHEQRVDELVTFLSKKPFAHETPQSIREDAVKVSRNQRPLFDLVAHIGGKCPSCGGTDIEKQSVEGEEGSRWQCKNTSCEAQLATRILHMVSRKCLDIEGLGEEACDEIAFRAGREEIRHPFDILHKPTAWFANLSWKTESGKKTSVGESKAKKIVAAIDRAYKLPLSRWLCALGIHTIGENTSKEISRLCKDVTEMIKAVSPGLPDGSRVAGCLYAIANGAKKDEPPYDLLKISSHLGPVSCKALQDYAGSVDGVDVLQWLVDHDIKSDNYDPIPVKVETGSQLCGKTVVITGTLSAPRPQIEALIISAGGKLSGSVSKKTDYLLAGEACGSKLEKAKAAGVKIITEPELRLLL